jgi:hypothetical protein
MFKIHPICFLKDAFKCYLTRGPDFEWQLPIVAKPFDFGAIMGINISQSSVFVFSGPLKMYSCKFWIALFASFAQKI